MSVARWHAFLEQIKARHQSVIAEAEASAHQFIANNAMGGGHAELSNALSAVKARLQALQQNLVDTWHGKVEDTILGEANDVVERDRQWLVGDEVKHHLDNATEELEIRVLAALAQAQLANAQATQSNDLHAIAIATGTHPCAQLAAVHEWRAMRAAERDRRLMRPPVSLALIMAWEQAQIAYWRKYVAVRSQFEPILARDPEMEVRSRMQQWYEWTAEHEEEWRNAGRPRSI
ncbi:MAG TPA: hypothetical protein VGM39_01205 [Kofleriaceae bacterium]|jgi:hypothetical protein